MIIVGIDPGFNGAFAVLEYWPLQQLVDFVEVVDAPVFWSKEKRYFNANIMANMFEAALEGRDGRHLVIIEKVGVRPGQGLPSCLRFGYGAGMWHGAGGHFRNVEIQFAIPHLWKKRLGVTADKETSLALARWLFPTAAGRLARKMDEGRAEAFLLAVYGLLEFQNDSKGERNVNIPC